MPAPAGAITFCGLILKKCAKLTLRIPARAEQANAVVRYILQGGKTNMKTWNKPEIEVIDVAMTMTGSKPADAEKVGAEADKYYARS